MPAPVVPDGAGRSAAMTLRTRLTIAFAIVVLVPVLVSAALVGAVLPDRLHDQVRGRAWDGATGAAVVLAEVCSHVHIAAEALARRALAVGPAPATAVATGDLRGGYAAVLGRGGRVVASSGTPPAGRPLLAADCTGGKTSTTDALVGRAVVTGSSRLQGAVVALPVSQTLARLRAAASGGHVKVLSGGRLVASSGSLPPGRARVSASVEPVAGRPFAVNVSVAEPAYDGLRWLLGLLLAAVLVGAWVLGRRLARLATRPLTGLSEAAQRVTAGDLDTVVPAVGGDEVGRVAQAFNVMTSSLRAHVQDLEHNRDELRRSVQRLGETLSNTHDLDRILTVVLDTAMASSGAAGGAILLDGHAGDDGNGSRPRGITRGDETAQSSRMTVPIAAYGRVRGTLELYGKADGRPFGEAEAATVGSLATHAAVAVENVLLHDEAQRMSVTDGLTGLWNRRFLMLTLRREVERAVRHARPLTVVVIDVDRFKSVNDEHGHQRGDSVLAEMAERLRAETRDTDTLARYGGEEFVLVLPETDANGAIRTCQRICSAVRERPFEGADGPPLRITVSVGAAIFPDDAANPDELLRSADQALYAAKRTGRDGWWLAEAVPPQDVRLGDPTVAPSRT